MMKTRMSLIALSMVALAGCAQAPVGTAPVQQLDATAVVWSTGSFR